MKIDHIGIAVESIEGALPFYQKALGLDISHREELADRHVKVAFLQAGEASLELLEPIGKEGVISKFLKERGPGLHHLAFRVGNVAEEMAWLKSKGLPTIEKEPRSGARGHLVCFLHPSHAHGVLVELVGA